MSDKDKGFASMDKDKVREIAHKGGEARKEQLGPEGYSGLGKKGGSAHKQSNDDDDDDNHKNKHDNRENHKK